MTDLQQAVAFVQERGYQFRTVHDSSVYFSKISTNPYDRMKFRDQAQGIVRFLTEQFKDNGEIEITYHGSRLDLINSIYTIQIRNLK